jgi:hypothetical protein
MPKGSPQYFGVFLMLSYNLKQKSDFIFKFKTKMVILFYLITNANNGLESTF